MPPTEEKAPNEYLTVIFKALRNDLWYEKDNLWHQDQYDSLIKFGRKVEEALNAVDERRRELEKRVVELEKGVGGQSKGAAK